jgi:hypothetical protein
MTEKKETTLPVVTELKVFPVNNTSKVKANGTVTLNNIVDLKFIVLNGPKGDFITWNGTKEYAKKDGTKGWDSPIFITDKKFNDSLTEQVLAKLTSVSGGRSASTGTRANAPTYDANMSSDDIPF